MALWLAQWFCLSGWSFKGYELVLHRWWRWSWPSWNSRFCQRCHVWRQRYVRYRQDLLCRGISLLRQGSGPQHRASHLHRPGGRPGRSRATTGHESCESYGKILITGGQGWAQGFTDIDPVFAPELFDPATKTFTELAPEAIPRNYHSVSILLADGTVLSGGGGLCLQDDSGASAERCHTTVDHPNAQIFTPPYLKTGAPRPVIGNLASATTNPGAKLRLTMEGTAEGVTFSLIRIGSVTHSINTDQRRVPLSPKSNGTNVVLEIPPDSGVVLPGAWYLFAVSVQGVPSVAKTVFVQL